jgi:hypothetical protein
MMIPAALLGTNPNDTANEWEPPPTASPGAYPRLPEVHTYTRVATCWRPRVKGLNLVVNSVFNSWRFEDVWLDR